MDPAREQTQDLEPAEEVELTVDASVDARKGVYADFAHISHNPEGFTLDFYAADPDLDEDAPKRAMLQVRVRLGHRMALRLHDAMAANIQKWAQTELNVRQREEDALRMRASGKHDANQGTE